MFTLQQLDHIALAVADPAKSAAWYRDVLGLERRHQAVWGDRPIMMAAGSTMVAFFPAAVGVAATQSASGPGLRHFAFRADRENFDQARVALARHGVAFEEQDHEVTRSIYFRDPDGFCLELTTYDLPKAQTAPVKNKTARSVSSRESRFNS